MTEVGEVQVLAPLGLGDRAGLVYSKGDMMIDDNYCIGSIYYE